MEYSSGEAAAAQCDDLEEAAAVQYAMQNVNFGSHTDRATDLDSSCVPVPSPAAKTVLKKKPAAKTALKKAAASAKAVLAKLKLRFAEAEAIASRQGLAEAPFGARCSPMMADVASECVFIVDPCCCVLMILGFVSPSTRWPSWLICACS